MAAGERDPIGRHPARVAAVIRLLPVTFFVHAPGMPTNPGASMRRAPKRNGGSSQADDPPPIRKYLLNVAQCAADGLSEARSSSSKRQTMHVSNDQTLAFSLAIEQLLDGLLQVNILEIDQELKQPLADAPARPQDC